MKILLNRYVIVIILSVILSVSPSYSVADTLSLGTIERPPFSFHNDKNEMTGFSVDLWDEIARRAKLEYTWIEYEHLADMIDSATSGKTILRLPTYR